MMVNLRFWSDSLTDLFEQEGYVIVRGYPGESLSLLRDVIASRPIKFGEGLYYSLMSNSFEYNIYISKLVRSAIDSTIGNILNDFRILNPSFLIKPPHFYKEFMLHQDWCFTDVDRFRMGTIWVPLCDVDESNGCLSVVPKSHRAFRNFVSGNLDTARIPMAHMPHGVLRPLPMRFGDVMVFNPLLFHGSFPNGSEHARPVATAHVLPEGAPFCYYHQRSRSETDRISLGEDDVLKDLPGLVAGRVPSDAKWEKVYYVHSIPTAKRLIDSLDGL